MNGHPNNNLKYKALKPLFLLSFKVVCVYHIPSKTSIYQVISTIYRDKNKPMLLK